jgi:hypothetical protein
MAEGCTFYSEVRVLPNPALDRSEPSPSHARPQFSTASSRLYSSMTASDEVLRRHTYIANPDLVERLATGAPLAENDWTTVYASGPRGYSDYPTLRQVNA